MTQLNIYTGLNYTVREINHNFKIKVSGIHNGKKVNTLVGVSGLIKFIGVEMANKLLKRAFAGSGDKQECKLRRGIKVGFYLY